MRSALPSIIAVVLAAGWAGTAPALARESSGTAAAKARFDEGEASVKAGKLVEAAAAFHKAIDLDPDFVDAHQRYIEITQRMEDPQSRTPAVPRLQREYQQLARRNPKRAVYQWALGFLAIDADTGDAFFKKALALDPQFARAHFLLARNADLRGDFAAQRDHLKAACDLNPQEPRYFVRYALAFHKSDPPRFRALALDVVAKFPTSPQAAEALYHLAGQSPNPERRAYFDRLRAEYPFDRYSYSASAMYDLYAELTNPADAASLAREMAKANPTSKTWAQRIVLQDAMAQAKSLIEQAQFAKRSRCWMPRSVRRAVTESPGRC